MPASFFVRLPGNRCDSCRGNRTGDDERATKKQGPHEEGLAGSGPPDRNRTCIWRLGGNINKFEKSLHSIYLQ